MHSSNRNGTQQHRQNPSIAAVDDDHTTGTTGVCLTCTVTKPKTSLSSSQFAPALSGELRAECKRMWGTSSELYFRIDELLRELANPNLHEIFSTSAFQVELWDRHGQHLRWVVAAAASIGIAHAAFDVAVSQYEGERLTLRKGAMVIREYSPASNTE